MKKFISLISTLLFNGVVGGFIGAAAGISPVVAALGANAVAIVPSVIFSTSKLTPAGSLMAGVLREVWAGEMIKALRGGLDGSWLDGIPDASTLAENDVIHLVDVGVDPDVLVNNTTYPIDIQDLTDGDKTISLDKFQTKATPVTDDELHAITYDKMARVIESHKNAIDDTKYAKAAHALCAAGNTASTPVLATTGVRDAETGRLRFTIADLIAMKKAMDKLKVPNIDRRLVLCNDHVNDLLATSESFAKQYNLDNVNGKVGRLYGFDIYESNYNPLYTTAGSKKALGTTASTGEFQCSFAFYTRRVFKATGSTKMYYSRAETDPQYQRNLVNFRHYFIALPKKADAGVVMRSAYSAS